MTTKIWIAEVAYLNQFRDASIHEADFEAENGAVRARIRSRDLKESCSQGYHEHTAKDGSGIGSQTKEIWIDKVD